MTMNNKFRVHKCFLSHFEEESVPLKSKKKRLEIHRFETRSKTVENPVAEQGTSHFCFKK